MKLNGEHVKKLLKKRGMSAEELSRRAGLTIDQTKKYLSEENNCPRKTIQNIADILDVDWLEVVRFAGSFY